MSVPVHHAAQTKRSALSSHSTADLNIGTMASGIPSSTSFTPPAKLASVLAGEMPTPPRQPNASKIGVSHMLVSPPPKSKLPMAPSRTVSSTPSKVPRSAATVGGIKVPVYPIDGSARSGLTEHGVLTGNSKLPMPALQRTTKLSSVRGLWRA